MKVRFLLDENLSPRLKLALRRYDDAIDVIRVGDDDAPSLGTLDPDVLCYLEVSQRFLVTDNRSSIPEHIAAHSNRGGKHWGIAWCRPGSRLGQLAAALYLIWTASEAEEWLDQTLWIPF
jgi:hypothetical protein